MKTIYDPPEGEDTNRNAAAVASVAFLMFVCFCAGVIVTAVLMGG